MVWDLTAKTFAQNANFMGNPQGLGVKVKIDSFEVERVSFIESVQLESSEIGGKIYFKDYEQFNAFCGVHRLYGNDGADKAVLFNHPATTRL
ncbi:MAG: phage distal tail protein domain-containing protein [Christensenellales bacterium]